MVAEHTRGCGQVEGGPGELEHMAEALLAMMPMPVSMTSNSSQREWLGAIGALSKGALK